jgi:choline dehydrogenase-like flavoprotein
MHQGMMWSGDLALVNSIDAEAINGEHFDIVIIGSGFGSSFFLFQALKKSGLRILVIERGRHNSWEWQVEHQDNSNIDHNTTFSGSSDKPWNFTIGLGGGTNCWFGQANRLHPTDFRLKTLYGVGQDWPVDYDEMEPWYAQAETIMSISGDPELSAIFPRSTPYPQPPHRMSAADRVMKQAQPDMHFVMPTARARVATETRPACCCSMRCNLCPSNAKFTVNNSMLPIYQHPNVSVCLESTALRFNGGGNSIQSLVFENRGKEHEVKADLFVLGANSIHSPAILMQSDMGGGLTGRGLHEGYGIGVEAYVDGLDNFDGSTITTGVNYSLYDGPFRSESGSAMIAFENRWPFGLRPEKGRWRQIVPLTIVIEELPDAESRVLPGKKPDIPEVIYNGPSDYALKGVERVMAALPQILSPLPVEEIFLRNRRRTESHHQGTLRMGRDAATSVVDEHQIHHRWRNLVAVGASVFPTCTSSGPSLTAAALSLRAADHIL